MLGAREYPSGAIVHEMEERVKMLGAQLTEACEKYPKAIPKELWCVTIGLEGYAGDKIEKDILARQKKYKYLAAPSVLPGSTSFVFKWLFLIKSRDKGKSKEGNGLAKVAVMLGEPLAGSPTTETHVVKFGWDPQWSRRIDQQRNPILAFPILEVVELGIPVSVSAVLGLYIY